MYQGIIYFNTVWVTLYLSVNIAMTIFTVKEPSISVEIKIHSSKV